MQDRPSENIKDSWQKTPVNISIGGCMSDPLLDLFLPKFKDAVNNKVQNLRLDLVLYDGFMPRMLGFTLDGVEEAEINLDETPKDEAGNLIREYARKPGVMATALIFMADTLDIEADEKREVIPEDITDEPNKTDSIMVYLYTKGKSEYRRLLYSKRGDTDYWFSDEGWKEITALTGRFANPFMK